MTATRLFRTLALPLVLAGLLGSAAPALACDGKTVSSIVFQAVKYGRVADGYGVPCLREAQQAQTADLLNYTSSDSAIQTALNRAVVAAQVPAVRGSASNPVRRQESFRPVRPAADTGSVALADTGPLARLINAGAESPESVPLPVVVLGGLAFVMIAGGLGSFLLRRRLEPARGPRPPAPR